MTYANSIPSSLPDCKEFNYHWLTHNYTCPLKLWPIFLKIVSTLGLSLLMWVETHHYNYVTGPIHAMHTYDAYNMYISNSVATVMCYTNMYVNFIGNAARMMKC